MERTLSFSEGDAGPGFVVAPDLVLALRSDRPAEPLWRLSLGEVDEVHLGRGTRDGFTRISRDGVAVLDVAIADGNMSSAHAHIVRSGANCEVRDMGSKNGTFVDGRNVSCEQLHDGAVLEVGSTFFVFRRAASRGATDSPDSIVEIADSPRLSLHRQLIRDLDAASKVLAAGAPIAVVGETGAGKEVFARALHESTRAGSPWVAVNCGALSPTLLESELFGHQKGSFSGADREHIGFFRAADGGTVFLDEVAELSLEAQVKLLRVLQERSVIPVGSTRPVKVDFQLISATHRDLGAMVESGQFREDLYARLRGTILMVPPLRDRREDIGLLAARFLAAAPGFPRLSRRAARQVFLHSWPRNVRELELCSRAAAALSDNGRIEELEFAAASSPSRDDELRETLRALLRRHQGNVSQVARELGKARVQVRRWCTRFGIDIEQFRL